MVAELELQAFGNLAFHRHAGDFIRRLLRPPVAGGDLVALGQVGRPGQAQVTLDRPVTRRFLGDDLLHRFAIDADQPPRDHRIQRRRFRRQRDQAIGERLFVRGQDVQGKIVRCVLRQLVLPGVQQLAAKQGDQCHRQQDQAKCQGLPCGCQRMAQQLAQPQAPGQGGTGQQASQAFQQQQQQAAQYQRRDHAAAEQGEGQYQVQAQAPHDQPEGAQCGAVDHPGAGGNRQQVPAQHAQGWNPPQCGQWRQGEPGQGHQSGADSGDGREQASGWNIGR
ncbi:hypothetical protein D3C76_763080 [compost metagenome]